MLMRRWLPLVLSGVVAITATGCATAISPATCGSNPSRIARAPKNFGEVLDDHGAQTGVYRGADLTDCSEVAFLDTLGIKHILQLNAPRSEAPKPLNTQTSEGPKPHMEGRFEVLPLSFSAFTIGRSHPCTDVGWALTYLADPAHRPVYVHCSKGRDRTGFVIGMFERQLGRPVDSVLEELQEFGHHGLWSALFGQIDRQLNGTDPGCL
jgi:hypothetical protein